MAPECFQRNGKVGRQADIWAMGCCIVEMFTGRLPYEGKYSNEFTLIYNMAHCKDPPKRPDNISNDAHEFILSCFVFIPKQRPGAHRLKKMAFVKGLHNAASPFPQNSTIGVRASGSD